MIYSTAWAMVNLEYTYRNTAKAGVADIFIPKHVITLRLWILRRALRWLYTVFGSNLED